MKSIRAVFSLVKILLPIFMQVRFMDKQSERDDTIIDHNEHVLNAINRLDNMINLVAIMK